MSALAAPQISLEQARQLVEYLENGEQEKEDKQPRVPSDTRPPQPTENKKDHIRIVTLNIESIK